MLPRQIFNRKPLPTLAYLDKNRLVKKVQVRIPQQLLRDAKAIAEQNEMTFHELVARGLQHMRLRYPVGKKTANPPKTRKQRG